MIPWSPNDIGVEFYNEPVDVINFQRKANDLEKRGNCRCKSTPHDSDAGSQYHPRGTGR